MADTTTDENNVQGSSKEAGNIKSMPLLGSASKGTNPSSRLEDLFSYVEAEADKAMAWYWQKKGSKAKLSRGIQLCAVVFTALGAIFPVATNLLREPLGLGTVDTGLLASLFVGIAAALIGLDRAFGYSSGWARYVLTATTIRKSLEEFRMDWAALSAKAGANPTPDQLVVFVARARDFIVGVQELVLQETRDWVTEFQKSTSQLDKEVGARLDALKSQIEKATLPPTSVPAPAQPGSIELTVPNADKADGFEFDVLLESQDGKVTAEKIAAAKNWVRINVPPGQYKLSIGATAAGRRINTAAVIVVKSQEISKAEVSLPV